jgi:hypothetical protein
MDDGRLRVRVECYAGYRDEETPRCLYLGPRCIRVEAVLDRWLAPEHRYFKLRGDDGGVYIVRYDSAAAESFAAQAGATRTKPNP